MSRPETFEGHLIRKGLSRRSFLKLGAALTSLLALSPDAIPDVTRRLLRSTRPSVIWLSFQECTGCTESLTRSHTPSIEDLIFDYISLDYHHTLQAAAGEAAEAARLGAMRQFYGKYLLIVDGSIPLGAGGAYSTIAGRTNLDLLKECSAGAAAIIAIGSCAAYGGIAAARPNPTGAASVAELMEKKLIANRLLVNIPGCPPLPIAIGSVLAHFLIFDRFPALDDKKRPLSIYGDTVHQRCSRFHFYEQEKFAESFDDEGARKGWCLYKLGCKGPTTHNACAVYKWNNGTSFPIQSGHPCLGCSEPNFWDGGFYRSLDDFIAENHNTTEAAAASVEQGRQLYEESCVYCHPADPARFETEPGKIVDVLRNGNLRSHRRLELGEEQLTRLQRYLESIE